MSKNKNNIRHLQVKKRHQLESQKQELRRAELNINKSGINQGIEAMKSKIDSTSQQLGDGIYWDTLLGLHFNIGKGIADFLEAIKNNYTAVKAADKDTSRTSMVVMTITTDCLRLADELTEVKSRHADKKGKLTDPNELELYYEIGEKYRDIYARFQQFALQSGTEMTTVVSGLVTETNPSQNLEAVVNETLSTTKN